MSSRLEYEESDGESSANSLFGSDPEDVEDSFQQQTALKPSGDHPLPLGSTRSTPIGGTRGKSVPPTEDQRRQRLRRLRHHLPQPSQTGADSLKAMCLMVIRANVDRIVDVGGVAYDMIAPILDDLPRAQLEEIENNSPHLKRDTDWLWEGFFLDDYPRYYREWQGNSRKTSWRKLYNQASEETAERQKAAVSKMKDKYRALEEDRQRKKIVVMQELIDPKKGSLSKARRGAAAAASYASVTKTHSAISKARQDVKRERVALTHASGRFTAASARAAPSAPISRPTPAQSTSQASRNTGEMSMVGGRKFLTAVSGPPLRAPRAPGAPRSTSSKDASKSKEGMTGSSRPTPTQGSSASKDAPSIPSYLKRSTAGAITKPTTTDRGPTAQDLRKGEQPRVPDSQHIPKARVSNYEVPRATSQRLDFFAPPPSAASVPLKKRPALESGTESEHPPKRSRGDEVGSPATRRSWGSTLPIPSANGGSLRRDLYSQSPSGLSSASASPARNFSGLELNSPARLASSTSSTPARNSPKPESILFMKKKTNRK